MWRNGNRIHFQTSVQETGLPVVTGRSSSQNLYRHVFHVILVILFLFLEVTKQKQIFYFAGAYIDLLEIKMGIPRANPCSGKTNVESDAIFAEINKQLEQNPDEAKKINAIFLYNITVNGKQISEWSK